MDDIFALKLISVPDIQRDGCTGAAANTTPRADRRQPTLRSTNTRLSEGCGEGVGRHVGMPVPKFAPVEVQAADRDV